MRSQVTLRSAFTVCLAVVVTAAAVLFLLRTRIALTLTVAAMMQAIALDHLVRRLEGRGMRRGWAVLVTTLGLALVVLGLVLVVVPATVEQVRQLVTHSSPLFASLRDSPSFQVWNERFGLEEQSRLSPATIGSIVAVVGSALGVIAGLLTVFFLSIFMLLFGGPLLRRALALTPSVDQPRWRHAGARCYEAIGGYLGGMLVICSINATLTTACLAFLGTPYFLCLGLLCGFSSLVPYAGPIFTGGLVTVLTGLTVGPGEGLAALCYFVLYGQLEGNVLGPFVFRRAVHLDPLVAFLAVLFLTELLGITGAVLAVPAVAVAQVFLREFMDARRDHPTSSSLPALFQRHGAPPADLGPLPERSPAR